MLILRLIIGGLFAGHGMQKLAGWFGGHGPEGTGQFFDSLGLPGQQGAQAAGTAETAGGVMVATGIGSSLGGAAISAVMLTAIRHVHLDKGLWNSEGGYEFPLVILAAVFAIVERDRGATAAAAQLAAGAVGSALMSEAGRRESSGADTGGEVGAPDAPPVAAT